MSENNNANNIQSKTIEMQNKMVAIQKKLALLEIEGNAGGGMVTITLNGRYEAKKVVIDPSLLTQPMQILCDLVASAITDTTRKVEAAVQNEMLKSLQDFKLPNVGGDPLKQATTDTQSKS